MKLLKWALIAVGAVVLLFAAVLAFIAATFDPNQYKAEVAKLVKDKTQRTLTIEGDIRLMLFPKLGVHLGKTRFSEFKSDQDFASLDDMRVSLEIIPLLSKQIVVDEIQLDGLRAGLVKHKDGKMNIDDLLGGEKKEEVPKPAEPKTEQSPIKLAVDGVRISKAALTWKDEAAGAEYAVTDFTLKTGRVAPGVPTKFEMSAQIRANQPKTDVKLQVSGVLNADLEQQIFSLAGLSVKVNGEAAGITNLSTNLRADIEAKMRNQQVDVVKLGLDVSGNFGKDSFKAKLSAPKIEMIADALSVNGLAADIGGTVAGVTLSEGALRVPQLAMDLDKQTVIVDGITFKAKGKRDADNFDVTFDAPKVSISKDKASGSDIVLQLNAHGPKLDATASIKVTGVEGSGKAVRIGQFVLTVDAKQADNALKGSLSTPILADLDERIFQLPKLAGDFDVASPELPTKKLKMLLSGSVATNLKKQTANVDLAMKLDDTNIKAKAAVSDFAALRSTFDVAIDKLDVDKYLPPKKAGEPAKPATGPQAEQPIDLSPLKKLDVSGSLRIGDLKASNIRMQNVRVDVRAKNGQLVVEPLAANLYQGSLKGRASIDANTNRIATKQDLVGISIGPLLHDAAGQDLLEGRGNVSLDVTTTGNLVSAMKKTLNGTAKLSLKNGAIKGINLNQSLRNAKAMFTGGKKESEQSADAGEKTDFSELEASFDIKNGIAHNGDFLVKSPFLRLTGEGDVNIPDSSLNYLAKAAVVASSAGQGGKDLGDLKGLTIPVRASGPFTALKYKLEFGSILSDSAKQKLDETKTELKGKLEDKLKSKLFGKPDEAAPAAGAPADGQAQPPAKPQDKLKDKLKKLF
ncbi:MAG: AsmA family protein [Betaproteobacteria bacterium]